MSHPSRQCWRQAIPVGSLLRFFGCLVLALAVAGCQVHFVSNYDEATDTLARSLQSKIDRQFQSWIRMPAGSPGLKYDDKANRDFYADVSADLSVLEGRARAQPLNHTTVAMIETIRNSMDRIETLHKQAQTISAAALSSVQAQIDFQFQQLIAFELAKKRGETPKS